MDYKMAYKILRNSLEKNYIITMMIFDLPDMFVFCYENSKVTHGTAFDYYAVTKMDGAVIRDGKLISESMDRLSNDELEACKKRILIEVKPEGI